MHTSIPTKNIVLAGVISVVILGAIGYLFFKDYYVSIQKKTPDDIACTMEAKLCPDGSAVGRVPPSCEFAPCPGESNSSGGTRTSTAPVFPGQTETSKIPDLPLDIKEEPLPPLNVKYIIEHRSALNDKRISVTGMVAANFLENQECEGEVCTAMYMAPGIILATDSSANRNPLYDLRIIMREEDRANSSAYAVGAKVKVTGYIQGNADGVIMSTQ